MKNIKTCFLNFYKKNTYKDFYIYAMGDHIWGKYAPKTSKMGVNRQFQAKMATYENRNSFKTINQIKTKFQDQAGTNNNTSLVV